VARRIKKRGLMILLSDLLAEPAEVMEALHHMKYRGHDLIIFQVLDHSELSFEFDGQVRFVEPESGRRLQTDPRAIRAAYLDELRAFIDEYKEQSQSIRADFVTIDNAMTFDKALVEFLVQRQGRF
jgi:predicted dehydrogenase